MPTQLEVKEYNTHDNYSIISESQEMSKPLTSWVLPKELKKKKVIPSAQQSQPYYNGWDGDYRQVQQQQQHIQQQPQQQQQHHHRHFSSSPQTYYEKSYETNEIVFGAVQEQDGRREAVVIKAVDYGDPSYNHYNIRPRLNYMGYSQAY